MATRSATTNALGDYLRARRELTRPEEHGLPDLGRRRVPGLRREEVAMLAGVSAEYYVRLERGRDRNPSPQVLDALARVLGLDAESRRYLAGLVTPAPRPATPTAEADREDQVPSSVLQLLDVLGGTPAFVLGRWMDVLASNRAAIAFHGGPLPRNVVRHLFLDATARDLYPDWSEVAAEAVASLRASAAGHLHDERAVRLVGELTLASREFGSLWARHDVRAKTEGAKRVVSPSLGEVTVVWQGLTVTSAPGQILVTYLPAPDERSRAAFSVLAERTAAEEAESQRLAHRVHG